MVRVSIAEPRPKLVLASVVFSMIIFFTGVIISVFTFYHSPNDPQFSDQLGGIISQHLKIRNIATKYNVLFAAPLALLANLIMQLYVYISWRSIILRATDYLEIRNKIIQSGFFGSIAPLSMSPPHFRILMLLVPPFVALLCAGVFIQQLSLQLEIIGVFRK